MRDSGKHRGGHVRDGARLRQHLEVRPEAHDGDVLPRHEVLRDEGGGLHGRIADQLRVVGHDREVVQRVDVLDASRDLERAREREAHVAHRDRHGVAVDDDPAALGVGDEPGAVVIAVSDAGHGVRHVEVHEHERRRDGLHVLLALARERGALARRRRLFRRPRRELLARPFAERVVAMAALRREPAAVVIDDALPLALRLVESHEAHGLLAGVGDRFERVLQVVEVLDRRAADAGDDAAARNLGLAEHIAGVRDVDALHRPVDVPRLLIRQLVEHAVAVFDVFGGSDLVQVVDGQRVLDPHAAALDRHLHLFADGRVELHRKRHELRDQLALHLDQDVAGLELVRRGRLRDHLLDDEQPRLVRVRGAHARFRLAIEAEPAQLRERLVDELRLERAARHGLVVLDLRQRDLHAVERQEEARRGLRVRAGVQRHDAALDVDHRRARRAARRARRGLQIERVEVVVVAAAVVRRLAVEPRYGPREDRELLARVVADDADIAADLRRLRHELELGRLHELQLLRVVFEEAEVVDRVAIHGREIHFLLIEEHGLRAHGAGRHDVAIREDDPALRVDDEAGGLARGVALGIERASAVDLDRDHAGSDTLERAVPALLLGCERERYDGNRSHDHAEDPRSYLSHERYSISPITVRVTIVAGFCSRRSGPARAASRRASRFRRSRPP